MPAIRTQYKGPTDTRGSRIVATSYAGRTSVSYDDALSADENHRAAATAHVTAKLAPRPAFAKASFAFSTGELPDGSYAHVLAITFDGEVV